MTFSCVDHQDPYSKTIIWLFFWLVFPWPKNQFLAQEPTVQSNPAAMVPTGSNGGTCVLCFFSSSVDLMTKRLHCFQLELFYGALGFVDSRNFATMSLSNTSKYRKNHAIVISIYVIQNRIEIKTHIFENNTGFTGG
jgi:hypothetical protein